MEMNVLEKSKEHLFRRILLAPAVEGSDVVGPKPGAVTLEVAEQVRPALVDSAPFSHNLHERMRPSPLDRVPQQEDDPCVGKQSMHPSHGR
jgi:hypothetical protein